VDRLALRARIPAEALMTSTRKAREMRDLGKQSPPRSANPSVGSEASHLTCSGPVEEFTSTEIRDRHEVA
jgi:hypothetical protein